MNVEVAKEAALRRASCEPDFWCAAEDLDGATTPTAVIGVGIAD